MVQRAMLSVVIAPMAVAFFLIACTMAGPREAIKILGRRQPKS